MSDHHPQQSPNKLYQRWLFGRAPRGVTATSKAARDAIAPKAPALRAQVLMHVVDCGERGATADETQASLDLRPQTCSARCNELRQAGLIRRDGRKRRTASGCSASVYVATEAGRNAAQ